MPHPFNNFQCIMRLTLFWDTFLLECTHLLILAIYEYPLCDNTCSKSWKHSGEQDRVG